MGFIEKSLQQFVIFQKSCLDALVIGGKMSFWSEMRNFQHKNWNV